MNPDTEFDRYIVRLREFIQASDSMAASVQDSPLRVSDASFNRLALHLFALQAEHNPAYGRFCRMRGTGASTATQWKDVPAIPVVAFKELELTSLALAERTVEFRSSGTTGQLPSRHYHSPQSLSVYQASLWSWFRVHLGARQIPTTSVAAPDPSPQGSLPLCFLTPPPSQVPHSSLAYMFDTIRRECGLPMTAFTGRLNASGQWTVDTEQTIRVIEQARAESRPLTLLGTAFNLVHLLDHLGARRRSIRLPPGSRVMETGGYKGRSRSLSSGEMKALLEERLGLSSAQLIGEYGMCELSSQAYAPALNALSMNSPALQSAASHEMDKSFLTSGPQSARQGLACGAPAGAAFAAAPQLARPDKAPPCGGRTPQAARPAEPPGHFRGDQPTSPCPVPPRCYYFPPWVRVRLISPETGGEVADGETGLLCVYDLANVRSVMAVQTEDLGVRRGDGFELIGRAPRAEPRGCSLLSP